MTLAKIAFVGGRTVLKASRMLALANAGYIGLLTVAAGIRHTRQSDTLADISIEPSKSFAFLVPAHNEELLIARTVSSLLAQDFPAELVTVHVVADRCDDATAAEARNAGATVYETASEPGGKAHALNWLVEQIEVWPEAYVVIDADTVVDPTFLRAVSRRLESGADVVQAHYAVLDQEASPAIAFRSAAFAVRHFLRPLGREALGLSAGLFGNGMVFRPWVLAKHKWSAELTEDVAMHQALVRDGLRVAFEPAALISAEMPSSLGQARDQNARWERGRIDVAKSAVRNLRRDLVGQSWAQRLRVIETSIDQLIPPLSVVVAYLVGGLAGSVAIRLVLGPAFAVKRAWLVALAVNGAAVAIALRLVRASRSVWIAVARSPFLMMWKVRLYGRALIGREGLAWVRTERNAETEPGSAAASLLGGLLFDDTTMGQVVERIEKFIEVARRTGDVFQVATVNTDYLANAREDEDLLRLLQETNLLTVDGMPLIWAARRHGTQLHERVTGADLVPELASLCALRGYRMFLVGAAPGVASNAASILRDANPGLAIEGAGCSYFESLDDMDLAVLDQIAAFNPDVVLVALGHAKQEWWGHRFGSQVGTGVVIGVGGSLDFLTGTTQRAPLWMRSAGLEWLHRMVRNPKRLGPRYARDLFELKRLLEATPAIDLRPQEHHGSAPMKASDFAGAGIEVADVSSASITFSDSNPNRALVVNLDPLHRLDRGIVTNLVVEARRRRDAGALLVVCGGGVDAKNFLGALHVDDYLNYRSSLDDAVGFLLQKALVPGKALIHD